MLKRIFILSVILLFFFKSKGQEFDCNLTVNTTQINSREDQIFDQMQQDLFEFVNNQRWTEDVIAQEERIKCDIIVNIKKMSGQSSFVADIMIQSSRPIYGSDYDTPLFNYIDEEVAFQYQQGQPLFYAPNTFNSNLTSAIAFYLYMILAYDYDSFEKNGGANFLDKANEIVLTANQSGDKNWTPEGKNKRSRYNLITQLMNPQYSAMREGIYKYHRLAFDTFVDDPASARKKITEVITSFQKIYNLNPNSPVLSSFFESKSLEITNIFQNAPMNEKQAILKVLRNVDAINMDKYNKILKGKR